MGSLMNLRSKSAVSGVVLTVVLLGAAGCATTPKAGGASGGNERTYCAWFDAATDDAAAALFTLGYGRPGVVENDGRVIVTEPKNGAALRVELVNLVGRTKVKVSSVPADQGQAIDAFWSNFESTLHKSECPK